MIQMHSKLSEDTMKLSKSELKLLILLSRRREVDLMEIRSSLGLIPARISQLVSSLRENGLIEDTRHGREKAIAISGSKHALLFVELTHEFEHMDLPQILSGSNLEVLSAVSHLHLKSRAEIHKGSLVSEASVARSLSKLRQRGIVSRNSIYAVSERFSKLREFVMEFRHYLNRRIAGVLSERAHIVWEANHEFIIECDEQAGSQGFLQTSVSVFGKYGAPFILSKSYLVYSPFLSEVSLEDALLHSLLVGGDLLPTLITWYKNRGRLNLGYLRGMSIQYGNEGKVDELANYMETEGANRKTPLPPWNEFMDKYRGYEKA